MIMISIVNGLKNISVAAEIALTCMTTKAQVQLEGLLIYIYGCLTKAGGECSKSKI